MTKQLKQTYLMLCLLMATSLQLMAQRGVADVVAGNGQPRGSVVANGVQPRSKKGGAKVAPTGTIVYSPTKLCLADLQLEHKKDLARLKRAMKLRSISIVAAADDYWYYSIEGKKGQYGALDQQGQVVVPPSYSTCYYCPVQNPGTDAFNVTVENAGETRSFSLWHPYVRGSFVAANELGAKLYTIGDGRSVDMPSYPYTYYHGYFLTGIAPENIRFVNNQGTTTLMAVNPEGRSNVTLLTSDGRPVYESDQLGLAVEDCIDGVQPASTFLADNEGVVRVGAFLLNNPARRLPPIFGQVDYRRSDRQWWVAANTEENPTPYDPAIHTGISYHDDGEKLYYQRDYKGCIDFYSPHVADSAYLAQSPWAPFYAAAAYVNEGMAHFQRYSEAMTAFENVATHRYGIYYNDRFAMQQWPNLDLTGWQQASRLFDKYESLPSPHAYSEAVARMRSQLSTNIQIYQQNQLRYDNALASLDSRIAAQKEAERRAAEEQAAREAAVAAAFANLLGNTISNLASGLSGGSTPKGGGSVGRAVSSGGGGSSASSSSSSSSSSDGELQTVEKHEKCSRCGGSGECTICHGTGKGPRLGYDTKCDACRGNKKCSQCQGKGYKVRYENVRK